MAVWNGSTNIGRMLGPCNMVRLQTWKESMKLAKANAWNSIAACLDGSAVICLECCQLIPFLHPLISYVDQERLESFSLQDSIEWRDQFEVQC